MDDQLYFLITVLYEANLTLMKCALCVKRNALIDDCFDYPMEPENRELLHGLLPPHVQSCGPVVAVEPIFAIQIVSYES